MEPGGSMPHSQELSNNSYLEQNQPNSSCLIKCYPLKLSLILSLIIAKEWMTAECLQKI